MTQDVGSLSIGFEKCNFNDKRLNKRIIEIARVFSQKPGSKIFAVCEKNALKKAAYNFFKNTKVTCEKIKDPHMMETIKKIEETEEDVLLIQDTTYVGLNLKKAFENQNGYLGKTKDGTLLQGFAIHSNLAVTASNLPLGLVHQECYQHEKACNKEDLIEKKESYRWLKSMEFANQHIHKKNLIHVSDREGDLFEALSFGVKHNQQFIIRAAETRKVCDKEKGEYIVIKDFFKNINTCFEEEIEIYDKNLSKYKKRKFSIKYKEVFVLKSQKKRKAYELKYGKQLKITMLEIKSIDDDEAIQWVLHTNLEINNLNDALKIINYYKKRWHIENYHKTLKTAFKIEDMRLETLNGLKNMITMLSILAVRFYYMIHLSRIDGDQDISAVLEPYEWEALMIKTEQAKITDEHIRKPTIKEGITLIAILGGFMNRKKDGPPGILVIWRGWERLAEIASYHKIIKKRFNI